MMSCVRMYTLLLVFPVEVFQYSQFAYFKYALPYLGEQGMVDEAQKALEEAEALKKVCRHVFFPPFLLRS